MMLIGLVLGLLIVVPAAKAETHDPADWAPMVWSDKADYAPGEQVTLNGAHWTPGESVHIRVNDDTGSSWDRDVDVTADDAGGIVDEFNLPNWFVASYRVTATGESGAVATHTFTDANPQAVQLAPGSRTVAPGSSADYTVTVPIAGNDGQCTLDLSTSGLPAGATATLGATSLTGTKGDSPSTTLKVDTTAATPLGTTTFTITAARQSNCQGNGNLTGTANLVVAKTCTAASVTTQPSNASITYGANATFTAAGGGSPAPSVQWQVSTNDGSSWTNLPGETSTTLTVTKPSVAQNGNQYHAVFTNTCSGTKTATSNAAKLTVAAKAITVTPHSGQSKVYGASDPTLHHTANPALESGDGFTGTLGRAGGENAGSYAITLGSLSAGPNYNLSLATTPVNFTITKKAASLSAEDKSKVYGSADPALTTTDEGFLAGDLGAGKIIFSASRAAGESVAGGPYTITPAASDGATSLLGNYDVTYNTGKLTITKKSITVTADDKTKVYGSADPELTVTVPQGALESGDGLSGELVRAAGKDVGSYAITKGSLTAGGNYDLTVTAGVFEITKKSITVKADDKTKVYGSADPELTVSVPAGALESGDSLSGELVRAAGKDVGSYAITKGSLTAGGNYDLTVTPGTLAISKKAITVTADDKTKVVGAVDPTLTYKVTSGSLESGDNLSGALTRAPGDTVGAYAIKQGTLTAGGNYALTFVGSTLKIVYGWDGFLQPINDTAHQTGVQQSKFKLGQTIPAKFVLKNAAGAVVQQATNPTFTRSVNLGACDSTAATDTMEAVTPDAGSTFTWDGSKYHYNWSTKNLTAGEYRIYANLADGTKQYVDICLAK